eukprot:TRINITY_DN5041_c0_g1_i3.p4 TRINITY_DN5041_c0_g1~~TRINITY_DN5041_c0_g1_i3.p4  ORF type:complete len:210 (+),score=7.13 TRINITY_DN5041_c0_g1_i3:181-810(+)
MLQKFVVNKIIPTNQQQYVCIEYVKQYVQILAVCNIKYIELGDPETRLWEDIAENHHKNFSNFSKHWQKSVGLYDVESGGTISAKLRTSHFMQNQTIGNLQMPTVYVMQQLAQTKFLFIRISQLSGSKMLALQQLINNRQHNKVINIIAIETNCILYIDTEDIDKQANILMDKPNSSFQDEHHELSQQDDHSSAHKRRAIIENTFAEQV